MIQLSGFLIGSLRPSACRPMMQRTMNQTATANISTKPIDQQHQHRRHKRVEQADPEGADQPGVVASRAKPPRLAAVDIGQHDADQPADADHQAGQVENVDDHAHWSGRARASVSVLRGVARIGDSMSLMARSSLFGFADLADGAPDTIRPGLRMPFGSNSAFSRAASAASGAGCGSKTGIAARQAGLARTSVAWPPPNCGDQPAQRLGFRLGLHAQPDQAALPVVEGVDRRLPCAAPAPSGAPRDGAMETRQTGCSVPSAKGTQSRMSRQSGFETLARRSRPSGRPFRAVASACRCGRRPTGRNLRRAAASPPRRRACRSATRAATPSGRCAAPETSALEPSASAMARGRLLVGQAAHDQRRLGLGGRQHLEGDVGDDGERAPGAGHQLRQVVAGDVLDDAAARLEGLAAAGDGVDAEHMVARRARLQRRGPERLAASTPPIVPRLPAALPPSSGP